MMYIYDMIMCADNRWASTHPFLYVVYGTLEITIILVCHHGVVHVVEKVAAHMVYEVEG